MKYKIIGNDLLVINNLFYKDNIDNIYKYILNLEYFRKESNSYKCFVKKMNIKDFSFIKSQIDFDIILNIVKKIYKNNYFKLSYIGEIVKLCYGDYLLTHTDSFHKIQAVLYLTNINENDGGIFVYNNKKIFIKKGDLVLFPGNRKHAVTTILANKCRYSITFGFN